MAAVNPPRRANANTLLRDLREIFLTAAFDPDGDQGDALAIDFIRKLLDVDALMGDTRTRDMLQKQLAKAREEENEDDIEMITRVLA